MNKKPRFVVENQLPLLLVAMIGLAQISFVFVINHIRKVTFSNSIGEMATLVTGAGILIGMLIFPKKAKRIVVFATNSPIVVSVLVYNVVDLVMYMFPSPTTSNNVGPVRGVFQYAVQLSLILPFLVLMTMRFQMIFNVLQTQWNKLPIPLAAKTILGLFLLIHIGHVILKTEYFPFSNVGMFASKAKIWDESYPVGIQYLMDDQDGGLQVFSLRRTGDPIFQGAFEYDHREALLWHKFPDSRFVYQTVMDEFDRLQLSQPVVAEIYISFPDGYHASIPSIKRIDMSGRAKLYGSLSD